jgi:hypothetical protein
VFRPAETSQLTATARFVTNASDGHDVVLLTGVGLPPDRRERIFGDDFESGGLSSWSVLEPREAIVELGSAAPPWR